MDETVIRVENVSKDFILPHEKVNSIKGLFTSAAKGRNKGKEIQHALKDISFEIKKGEFFGIVGRNGSGKSTLLKILAGIYQQNVGHVHTQGKLVPFIELGVGFNPELTGRENVYLNGAMLGFSEKEVRAMYKDIVDFAELERFMDQKLKNYSSGMQVRLAFSMATRAKAEILLIDEVLAVGDADFQRKCYDYFNHLKKQGVTVVFVSHDMTAVRKYCDRALLIENNHILKLGNTDEIAEAYQQLFTNYGKNIKTDTPDGGKGNRWGTEAALTKTLDITIDDEKIIITQQIEINQDIESPIIGFRIRNEDGQEITGTNTLIEGFDTSYMKQGKVVIIWTFENMLPEDRYSLDPSILHQDGVTVADWWNGAKWFTIKRLRRLPYIIQPGFTVKKTKIG